MTVLVGTDGGIHVLGDGSARQELAGHRITALAPGAGGAEWLALVDDGALWRRSPGGEWKSEHLAIEKATCLVASPDALFVGTRGAHLVRIAGYGSEVLAGFELVDDRHRWYTPWGGPPDTRSITLGRDTLYVNVHVGGILRSGDAGDTWQQTIDIDADVHQVLAIAEPGGGPLLLAAGAYGLSVSDDGGDHWRLETDGLPAHARYLRAVTVAGDHVLISASSGPGGSRAAVYRRPLTGGQFERCRAGLPEWFPGNVDTACLAASGSTAAIGSPDGTVFVSDDGGQSWTTAATGLPDISAVVVDRL